MHSLFLYPKYDSIEDYTNQWNKKRKRIEVYKIHRCKYTPNDSDEVDKKYILSLDMGARLFKAMKEAYKNKWKYIKILKLSNPSDKFDVQYYISEYKLIVQKKLKDKKTPGHKNKK